MVSQSTTCFRTYEGHALYKSVSPTTLVFVAVRWQGISRTVIMWWLWSLNLLHVLEHMRDMLSIKVCPLQPSYLWLSDVKVLVGLSQCSGYGHVLEHMRDMLNVPHVL